MRAVVFAGGEIKDYAYAKSLIKPRDILLAADSGLEHLIKMGLGADIVIGDMDSVKSELSGKEIIHLEVMKDETDTEAAALLAADRGADEIVILGATGGRIDHSLANVLLLKRLSDINVKASIIDEKNEVYYLGKGITLDGNRGDTISILPLSTLQGVTTSGLLYELLEDTLYLGPSRGVSNVMTDTKCSIIAKSGDAIVIKSRD